MSEAADTDRIEDVSPGDVISVDRGSGAQPCKVVHTNAAGTGHVVTFEDDDGETFQLELAAGTTVQRSLQSKWESAQSPTPHAES